MAAIDRPRSQRMDTPGGSHARTHVSAHTRTAHYRRACRAVLQSRVERRATRIRRHRQTQRAHRRHKLFGSELTVLTPDNTDRDTGLSQTPEPSDVQSPR